VTTAVSLSQLGYAQDAGEQPLCPACHGGHLHPYHVRFSFPTVIRGLNYGIEPTDWLEGWVAVCVGNKQYQAAIKARFAAVGEQWDADNEIEVAEPCGFSMPLTSGRRAL
jgi:hypothetical protein